MKFNTKFYEDFKTVMNTAGSIQNNGYHLHHVETEVILFWK